MSLSYTASDSVTFTITHARHLAAKVATDLKRIERLYPSSLLNDQKIGNFENEVVALLHNGYLESVIYGFKKEGGWIEPTLRYTAEELGNGAADDDPGRIKMGANVSGALFYSYLTYSSAWERLSAADKAAFEGKLPFQRGTAPPPPVSNGYFSSDKTYTSGGQSLGRSTIRSYV